jgi:thiamine-monophosphate kinase
MTKLDENKIIKIFQTKLGNKKFVSEDVEVFTLGKTKIIAKIDTMVESTDIPKKMKLSDAARKSVIACVSDFASKGIKPEYGIISINLPKSISRIKIDNIANGFKKACKEYGISIIGGDTNAGKEIVFNVCIFGSSNSIITRKGSNKGDLIFVTGPFGYT